MILLMQNNKDGISFKKEGQTIILLDETFVWIFAMSLPDKKGISFIWLLL